MGRENLTLRQIEQEFDQTLQQGDVLPDSWKGHARLAIRDSDEIPPQIEDKAITKALTLADENDVSPATAANKLIRAIADR